MYRLNAVHIKSKVKDLFLTLLFYYICILLIFGFNVVGCYVTSEVFKHLLVASDCSTGNLCQHIARNGSRRTRLKGNFSVIRQQRTS